jgi:hypothetical protein
VTDAPDIAVSDRFAEYLKRFRERFPFDETLARKHGLPTGHGRFEQMRQTQTTFATFGGTVQ